MKLTDPSIPMEARVARAKELGRAKGPGVIEELLAALGNMDETLNDAVVAALHAQKADAVLTERALDAKKPAADRVAALAGLRVLKPATAAPKIAALLDPAKEKREEVREAAALALAVFGAAAVEPQLVASAAKDPSAKVRYYAALALGELKTKSAKDAVQSRRKVEPDMLVQDALDQAAQKQARP